MHLAVALCLVLEDLLMKVLLLLLQLDASEEAGGAGLVE
jgi:hypothetical protein